MIYFTSDLHFCHDKNFIWGARGYNSVDDMNEQQIIKWNSIVKKDDIIYVLGDFCFDKKRIQEFTTRLNGEKHLIYGNHDRPSKINYLSKGFKTSQYAKMLRVKNKCKLWLCHYPTILSDNTPRTTTRDVIVLYGHIHLSDNFHKLYPNFVGYNVCVDYHNGYPVSLENILNS